MSDFRENNNRILEELSQSYNGETGAEKMNLVSLTSSSLLDVELKRISIVFATILARLYDNSIADLKRDSAKFLFLCGINSQDCLRLFHQEKEQIYSERKRNEFLRIIWHCLLVWMEYDASFIVNDIDGRYWIKGEL